MHLCQLHDSWSHIYATAMTLVPNGADIKKCETDFVFLATRERDNRLQLAIGESKTRKPISSDDVQNLLRVAKAFPADRFDVYLIFSKMTEFGEDELEHIFAANDEFTRRAIILTDRELEPWEVYRNTAKIFDIDEIVIDFEGMAKNTHQVFWEKKRRGRADGGER